MIAFITAALGLAVFALSYRATLTTGEADQAAFAVPLDFTVTESSALVNPLDAAPLDRYRALAPGAVAAPIIRMSAAVPGSGIPTQPALIGVPAGVLPGAALARRTTPARRRPSWPGSLRHRPAPRLAGADLPAGGDDASRSR